MASWKSPPVHQRTTVKTVYGSGPSGRIFQQKPVHSKPSQFKPSGWTDTIEGYLNEAKKLTLCLVRNRMLMGRPYPWLVTLNINEELAPAVFRDQWTRACRKLREQGIDCLWVREPTRNNHVHYHILVKNPITEKELRRAVEKATPPRSEVKWRQCVERVENDFRACHYVTKAKIRGRLKRGKGKLVEDMHAPKRLLFMPKLGIRKFGTVGDFWEKGYTKDEIWDQIRATEAKIAEGMETPHIHDLLDHIEGMIGHYKGFSRKKLERSYGQSVDSPAVRNWIKSFLESGGDYYAEYRRP